MSFTSNEPVQHAYVRVEGTPLPSFRTDEAGQFAIRELPEGEYTLVISGKGMQPKSENIVVDQDLSLEIQVEQFDILSERDWPTSKNNYSRNPVSSVDIDAEKLIKVWSADTPGQIVFSSPVISDGKVVFTTNNGNIIALDQNNGERLWSVRSVLTNRSTPTIVNGVVYVGGGGDGQIHALDLETGNKLWSAHVDFPPIYETPVYHEGVLYVSSHMDANAKVIALDAETGAELWRVDNGDGAFFGPTLGEERLYVGSYDSKELRALSSDDGSEIWKVSIEGQGFSSSPVYNDGVIYAVTNNFDTESGTLRAYDAATGDELWQVENIGNTESASPIVYDDIVVTGSAATTMLKAFNKNNGELIWETNNGVTSVNTGAVSSNGYLFITDLSSTMKIYDIFTGERLHSYTLNNASTSSIALSEGQVIVSDRDGIYSFTAYAEMTGEIIDEDGNPVENASIYIEESDVEITTDSTGQYSLQTRPGEYTIKVSHKGYKQIFEEVTLVSGYTLNKDYTLVNAKVGSIKGSVIDQRTKEPIEGLMVSIDELDVETSTDEQGEFSFENVYEGSFDINYFISGYVDTTDTITVTPGETTNVSVEISPVDVVVLHDYEDEITTFLNSSGVPAVSMEWEAMDELENFSVAYVNGAYRDRGNNPTEEQLDELISVAIEEDVSVVFADTWGPNYGGLRFLHQYLDDPANYDSYMSSSTSVSTQVRVEENHPITKDIDIGKTYTAIDNGHLAWFSQYSGREIASVGSSRDGFTGSGIAYKGVSENTAHVLMSTHAASPWTSPYNGWSQTQQQLLLNTMDYLLEDLKFAGFSGTVVDSEGNPIEDVNIEISDHAYHSKSNAEGIFELYHEEGRHDVKISKTGYATETMEVDFVHGAIVTEEIVLKVSDSGSISGTVLNKVTNQVVPYAEIHLYDGEGNEIDEEYVSNIGGNYEITDLDEGNYIIQVEERDFVYYKKDIQVGSEPISLDIELYPVPNVAVIGDSSSRSLRQLLDNYGIEATNYSNLAGIIDELESYDVVFFNQQSAVTVYKDTLEEFINEADLHGVSVIYGDDYYTSSPIHHLVTHLDDPKERTQHSDRTNAAGYVILEENPIFGDLTEGEFAEILIPNRSNIASFSDYSGYPLAEVKHSHMEDTHGIGVAYKPRTADNMEILMSGHAVDSLRNVDEYTEAGQQMFVNAIIWAAYTKFTEVSGNVYNEEGNPLYAEVGIKDSGSSFRTDEEDGSFNFGSIDGEFVIVVNAFGYETYEEEITVGEELEPLTIEMVPSEDNGKITGQFVDENTLEGINGARVYLVDYPRDTTTDISGSFTLEKIVPGEYTLVVEAEDYVKIEMPVEIIDGETREINETMKPSPRIGVIVDSQSSRATSLEEYLTPKGFIVEEFFYTDLDKVEEMDLIIANSDYGSDFIPSKEEFDEFIKKIDKAEVSVIWPGHYGPRGSIRFLTEYLNDPKEEFSGRLPTNDRNIIATKQTDHSILEGIDFDNDNQFEFYSENYYGFNDYTGRTLLTSENDSEGQLGSLVAIGGRTINSVEVLLSTMTFGYGFTDDLESRKYFDENREKILNNAILWALDNKDPLVGELHGQIQNNLGNNVSATITVEEIDYTIDTEEDGSFFLGLPEGEYTLSVQAFGHDSDQFPVTVTKGEALTEEFVLTSDNLGTFSGTVKSLENGDLLENAQVRLIGTPLSVKTDSNGSFELHAPAGTYEARITAGGYSAQVHTIEVIHQETTNLDITLGISEGIALIGTSATEARMIPLLESEGYEVDFWLNSNIDDLMEQMDEYALVILNDRHSTNMNEEKFKEFIDLTDEHEVSIIFPSQYGSNSISDLRDFYNDPEQVTNSYAADYVNYVVNEEHPIFSGYNVGDEIKLLEREGSNVQYSVFENYSGTTIGDLGHESGRIGSAVAYDFRTSNSVHILLSSLKVGAYGTPEDRWTEDAKQIYMNAIDWALSASLGEIYGTVTDDQGNLLEGVTIEIPEANLSTTTNINGDYNLGVGAGRYEVYAKLHGYEAESKEVTIEDLGEALQLDFVLEQTDRATVEGKVTDIEDRGIEDVQITLIEQHNEIEHDTTTDRQGKYQFTDLIAGDYRLVIEANGYQTIEEFFSLKEGEQLTKNYSLNDYNIAIIDDFKSDLSALFEEKGFAAQNRGWDIVDDVFNYKVILINSAEGTVEDLEKLIEEADKYRTSLVFTDTWAANGSIKLLEQTVGHPTLQEQGYNEGEVEISFLEEHPIFEGFDSNSISALVEQSPYATFKNFSGTNLANILVDGEDKGTSIAYEFQSENHMFMLLSSFHVNNMVGPERGWTEEGKQLFVQAVEWARDGIQQLPDVPSWTEEDLVYSNGVVELSGTAEVGATVTVIANEEEVAHTETKSDGTFVVEISSLDEGEYELELLASNDAGSTEGDSSITLIVDQTAPIINIDEPLDGLVTNKEVVTLSGTVEDDYLATVFVNDEEIELDGSSFEKQIILSEGTNELVVKARDIVGNVSDQRVTVILNTEGPIITEVEPSLDQYLIPGDELTVSISASENSHASFVIQVPTLENDRSSQAVPMNEVEPGKYVGKWTVPTDIQLEGGIVLITIEDEAGNKESAEAPGRLYLRSSNIDRIYGKSRFDTAIEISKDGWLESETVILARNDDYADALAGVPLAYQLDAPILLTRSAYIPKETLDEINRLNASKVIVLGGRLAISDDVVAELEQNGLEVERIKGDSRYGTASEIAKRLVNGRIDEAIIVSGQDFPDALSVAPHAAQRGVPILLTRTESLPEETENALNELAVQSTKVIGGSLAIDDEVLDLLPNAERIYGGTRVATNIAILEHFGIDSRHMYVATGNDFADSLTGSVLAARNNEAILLVRNALEESTINFLNDHTISQLTLFGGELAISKDVENELDKYLRN
ncbi:MAG TPA: carboxypeptidase regulatory-like domain-containing protein [Candidatus Avipropionibacterium sp.]|nr:carboxypeptidase regulatory-like domain-containing protein [Candidatus Avipropionibacterium sp.]